MPLEFDVRGHGDPAAGGECCVLSQEPFPKAHHKRVQFYKEIVRESIRI